MDQSPLDEPMVFSPYKYDHPASLEMENYWIEVAKWARNLVLVLGVLLLFKVIYGLYASLSLLDNHPYIPKGFLLYFEGIAIGINYGILGIVAYYCFLFSKTLSRALSEREQMLVHISLEYFQKALNYALISASIYLLSLIAKWFIFIMFYELKK